MRDQESSGGGVKGQTTLDFLLGVVLFLGIVLFTLGFFPELLEPFNTGNSENPATADRIADTLAQSTLGSPTEPRVLDRNKTVAFFIGEPSQMINLSSTDRVYITVTGDLGTSGDETPCWDVDMNQWTKESSCDSDDVVLRSGAEPRDSVPSITSTRVVSLQGTPVTLEVTVW